MRAAEAGGRCGRPRQAGGAADQSRRRQRAGGRGSVSGRRAWAAEERACLFMIVSLVRVWAEAETNAAAAAAEERAHLGGSSGTSRSSASAATIFSRSEKKAPALPLTNTCRRAMVFEAYQPAVLAGPRGV